MTSASASEGFARQLAETITWCVPRVDPAHPRGCLRSRELNPDLVRHYETDPRARQLAQVEAVLDPSLLSEHELEEWICLTPALIASVAQRRRELLGAADVPGPPHHALGGRLLLSFYEYTNHNGATEHETSGYLDINDVPPWDTWVGNVECVRTAPPKMKSIHTVLGGENVDRILVAWVPDAFVKVVDEAIRTEAMGMLAWSDDLPSEERAFGVWCDLVPAWLRGLRPSTGDSQGGG